jgi:GT2 family glycosyltransferase
MQASVVIPVWNGASVIDRCLEAVEAYSESQLLDVICVDNASTDTSAQRIRENYPMVKLLSQPVNLGFAGGVNVGIKHSRADVVVLLNQDCIVRSGWLSALLSVFERHPEAGIVGGTIFDAEDQVHHAGAKIHHPDAVGVHITTVDDDAEPKPVEYVTGALYAIRRITWETIGFFDEGFYPAYYEECDYCYRARRHGLETYYTPHARAVHLFSSQEAASVPFKHAANQHAARYRFVCKHFNGEELPQFFAAECDAVSTEQYFNHAVGRVLAARDILRGLPDIIERRRQDIGGDLNAQTRRLLMQGFTRILRSSLAVAEEMSALSSPPGSDPLVCYESLQQQEYELLSRIYFKSPEDDDEVESRLRWFWRLFVLRPLSFLIGRDYLLFSQLNTLHVARLDQLKDFLVWRVGNMERRLELLEVLADYDYR